MRHSGFVAGLLAFCVVLVRAATPGSHNCSTKWIRQRIDHFNFGTPPGAPTADPLHWSQRYLVYDKFYRNDSTGSIFFYTGNEGDVTLVRAWHG